MVGLCVRGGDFLTTACVGKVQVGQDMGVEITLTAGREREVR